MASTVDQATTDRTLPRAWEFFRAVSGLAAIAALAIVITSLPEFVQPSLPALPPVLDTAPAAHDRETLSQASRIAFPAPAVRRPIMVFYLVADQEQAYVADWNEQVGAMQAHTGGYETPDRRYMVLLAGTPEEERQSGQAILEALSGLNGAIVEVIDMRSVVLRDGAGATAGRP